MQYQSSPVQDSIQFFPHHYTRNLSEKHTAKKSTENFMLSNDKCENRTIVTGEYRNRSFPVAGFYFQKFSLKLRKNLQKIKD